MISDSEDEQDSNGTKNSNGTSKKKRTSDSDSDSGIVTLVSDSYYQIAGILLDYAERFEAEWAHSEQSTVTQSSQSQPSSTNKTLAFSLLESLGSQKRTPLLLAVIHAPIRLIRLLIQRGGDPLKRDIVSMTALHLAAKCGRGGRVVKLLAGASGPAVSGLEPSSGSTDTPELVESKS